MGQDQMSREAAEVRVLHQGMTERQRLAAAYRIVDHLGWCETIYGHLTQRVTGPGIIF